MVDTNKDLNYKVLELQTENENLKDEIIKMLKFEVYRLEKELTVFKNQEIPERDVSSHMIELPRNIEPPRKILRTMSEVSKELEKISIVGGLRLKKEE